MNFPSSRADRKGNLSVKPLQQESQAILKPRAQEGSILQATRHKASGQGCVEWSRAECRKRNPQGGRKVCLVKDQGRPVPRGSTYPFVGGHANRVRREGSWLLLPITSSWESNVAVKMWAFHRCCSWVGLSNCFLPWQLM